MALSASTPAPSPIVLESTVAHELGLAVNDTVSIRLPGGGAEATPFVVSGFYTPPPDPSGISRTSRQAWVPLTSRSSNFPAMKTA